MSLRRDPELGLRQLVAAILLQAVKDYFFALRHDLISRDSWLAAAPKLSEYGSGVTKSGMMKVNNGRGNQDMKAGGVEGVREVLEFFGGRRLESACLHAGLGASRVRSAMERLHAAHFAGNPLPRIEAFFGEGAAQ